MKTRTIVAGLLVAVGLALGPVAANAAENLAAGGTDALGYTLMHTNYEETPQGWNHYADTEKGYLHGGTLLTQYMNTHLYVEENLTYEDGTTHYDGGIQNQVTGQITPYKGSTHSTVWSLNTAFGPSWGIGDRALLAPIIGTNFYYWDRLGGAGTAFSSHEKYYHWTVAAGLVGRVAVTSRLRIQLLGEATYPIYNLIQAPAGSAKLGRSMGYRAALSFNYRVYGGWGLFARADFQYFKFGQANLTPSGSYFEPNSRTLNTAYMLGVSYSH